MARQSGLAGAILRTAGHAYKMAMQQGTSVPLLLSRLHDQLLEHRGDMPNYASSAGLLPAPH